MKESRGAKIELAIKYEKWQKARNLITAALIKKPDSHWLLTRLSTTYYEEKKYKKALTYVKRAYRLAPKCPLVLWDLAGTKEMLGNKNEAIKIWKSLLKRGERNIAYGECGERLNWTRSLLNDCRYRLGLVYYELGHIPLSNKYIEEYIRIKRQGIFSIYKLNAVKSKFKLK